MKSVVPIKCIDGQLGSGRLIDFALTSGRPAGPWHAYRLMSPFTCKFKEIMRASPRKFTHKKEDVTLNTEEAHPVETGGLRSHHVHFYWGPRVPRSLVLYQWSGSKSLGVHSLRPLNGRMRYQAPVSSTGHLDEHSAWLNAAKMLHLFLYLSPITYLLCAVEKQAFFILGGWGWGRVG